MGLRRGRSVVAFNDRLRRPAEAVACEGSARSVRGTLDEMGTAIADPDAQPNNSDGRFGEFPPVCWAFSTVRRCQSRPAKAGRIERRRAADARVKSGRFGAARLQHEDEARMVVQHRT